MSEPTGKSGSIETPCACRRCGKAFTLPNGRAGRLMACPHCHAFVRPMMSAWRRNEIAAVSACAALVLLMIAFFLPLFSVEGLGRDESFSILTGIGHLWAEEHHLVAVVIGVFSVVFPVLKLALVLVATSALVPLTAKWRARLALAAIATGKYSILDVLVVAVLVVAVKSNEFLTVVPQSGTVLFAMAVAVSIVSGLLVDLRNGSKATPPESAAS